MIVGLPKGRDLQRSILLAQALGCEYDGSYLSRSPMDDTLCVFLKQSDIADGLARRELDAGVVPDEWIQEAQLQVSIIAPLCWHHTRMSVLGAPGWETGLEPGRVATNFPQIASVALPGHEIRYVHGSAEAYPKLFADVAVDCVETGSAMRRHGLVELDQLFQSDTYLVERVDMPESFHDRLMNLGVAKEPFCKFGAEGRIQSIGG